jgi:hypothetical protein
MKTTDPPEFLVGALSVVLALLAMLGLAELRGVTARHDVCQEMLQHRDARYVGPPEVCEVPHAGD